MRFRPAYASASVAILLVEAGIALFVRDAFVRPYCGDVLAVALVYCILRAATPLGVRASLALTLLIAVSMEFAQFFNLLDEIGMRGNAIVRTILGGSFDVLDLLAYGAGGVLVQVIEMVRQTASAVSPRDNSP